MSTDAFGEVGAARQLVGGGLGDAEEGEELDGRQVGYSHEDGVDHREVTSTEVGIDDAVDVEQSVFGVFGGVEGAEEGVAALLGE